MTRRYRHSMIATFLMGGVLVASPLNARDTLNSLNALNAHEKAREKAQEKTQEKADDKSVSDTSQPEATVKLKPSNPIEVKIVDRPTPAQQAIVSRIKAAQIAANEATAEYDRQKARLDTVRTVEERAGVRRKLDAALKTYERARKNVVTLRTKLRQLANARAVVLRSPVPIGNGVAVRQIVDREDTSERFLILAPAGPVVVHVDVTIDGQPFRYAREQLIDQMAASLQDDAEPNQQPTWSEALQNPRFAFGRLLAGNVSQAEQYQRMVDVDQNGLVDRGEIRLFLARFFQGPAFAVSQGASYGNYASRVSVTRAYYASQVAETFELLDVNGDDVLSPKEMANAGVRLKSRDADDNDLLYAGEINGTTSRVARVQVRRTPAAGRKRQSAILIGPDVDDEIVFAALDTKYGDGAGRITADRFAALPKLFEQLDKNADGTLQKEEVGQLNHLSPHVRLGVELARTGTAKGFVRVKVASPWNVHTKSANTLLIELSRLQILFRAHTIPPRSVDYSQTANRYLQQYDKDRNKYLEKSELPPALVGQLARWDEDGDGKVFAKEILSSYARQQAPRASQVQARVVNSGSQLFRSLDVSGDSRLSAREMRTATERIQALDGNGDGSVAQHEIPEAISVEFALGNHTGLGSRPTVTNNNPRKPPGWFTSMDRNGDGDLTISEFLGERADFKKLDVNGDGFIDVKEAR